MDNEAIVARHEASTLFSGRFDADPGATLLNEGLDLDYSPFDGE